MIIVPIAETLRGELHAALRTALARAVKKGLTHEQFGGSLRSAIRAFSRAHEMKQLELNLEEVVDGETRLTNVLPEIEYSLATGGLMTESAKLLGLIDRAIGIEWQAPPRAAPEPRVYDPKLRYSVGDPVVHPKFGDGHVVKLEGKRVTIRFGAEERILIHADR